mgnify:FL=1
MRKSIILSFLLFTQCTWFSDPGYSNEIVDYVDSMGVALTGSEDHGFTLQKDSVVAVKNDSTYYILRFPTGLEKGVVYSFQNESNAKLRIKKLNYTDIEITINKGSETYKSIASIKLDFFQEQKFIEIKSTQYEVRSFNLKINESLGTLLISIHEEPRFASIQLKEDYCEQLKICGIYKEI